MFLFHILAPTRKKMKSVSRSLAFSLLAFFEEKSGHGHTAVGRLSGPERVTKRVDAISTVRFFFRHPNRPRYSARRKTRARHERVQIHLCSCLVRQAPSADVASTFRARLSPPSIKSVGKTVNKRRRPPHACPRASEGSLAATAVRACHLRTYRTHRRWHAHRADTRGATPQVIRRPENSRAYECIARGVGLVGTFAARREGAARAPSSPCPGRSPTA